MLPMTQQMFRDNGHPDFKPMDYSFERNRVRPLLSPEESKKAYPTSQPETTVGYFHVYPTKASSRQVSRDDLADLSLPPKSISDRNGTMGDYEAGIMQEDPNNDPSPEAIRVHRDFLLQQQEQSN